MKKNYLLCMLLSMITLGAWAAESGGASFESAQAVLAGVATDITYSTVTSDTIWINDNDHSLGYEEIKDGEYVKHWYKYTATHDNERVFIEDAGNVVLKSEATLDTSWPEAGGEFKGDPISDYPLTGTSLYLTMQKGQTVTFWLAAPYNYNSFNDNTGKWVIATPVNSTFEIFTFDMDQYPAGETMEEAIDFKINTDTYIFPTEEYVWLKLIPSIDGRVTFTAPRGLSYIRLYEGLDDYMGKSYNEIGDPNNSIFNFMVKTGTDYYIRLNCYQRQQVRWSLEKIEAGTDCQLPMKITAQGEYDIKAGMFYYQYKATKDGYLVLTSSSANSSAEVYNECNSQFEDVSVPTKNGFYLKRAVTADEEIIIAVQGRQGEGKFTLSEADPQAGWDAEHAIVIPDFTKETVFNLNPYADKYWFVFTSASTAGDMEYMIKSSMENRPDYVYLSVYMNLVTKITPADAIDSLDIRPDADTKYYVCWEVDDYAFQMASLNRDNPGSYKFTITEKAIPDGKYCDLPIDITLVNDQYTFVMGTENGIPKNQFSGGKDIGTQYYYRYVADKDGFITFTTLSSEWDRLWTITYVENCGDRVNKMEHEYPAAGLDFGAKYTMPVLAGHTYIWCPNVYSTKDVVEVSVTYRAPNYGESCSKPIPLTLGSERALNNQTIGKGAWYGITATQTGVYSIAANAGKSGYVEYKVGDCDAITMKTTMSYTDYMTKATCYAEAGQKILMYYYFNTWNGESTNGSIKIEYVKPASEGMFPAIPVTVINNQDYTILKGDDYIGGSWYAHTVTGNTINIKVTSATKFNTTKLLSIYLAPDFTKLVSNYSNPSKSDITDNGDGTFTATHTFTGAVPGSVYLFKFDGYADGSKFSVVSSTGIEDHELTNNVNVYPNPNNGEFTIVLGELTAETSAMIEVIDLSGKVIHREMTSGESATVNIHGVVSGTYLVKITTDSASVVKKVIIR